MTIYDISIGLSDQTPVYGGDPKIEITPICRISRGAGANVSAMRLGSHSGTHVDPPYHFVDGGKTVDELPMDVLVGECLVCPIEDSPVIGTAELEAADIPEGTERILFRTRNSRMWSETEFRTDYTYLDPEAAAWLVEQGIKLVGIDYLSIDKFKSGTHATHHKLLESGIVVVEGLDLSAVPGGMYMLACLPLKIIGGDGAPARAILIK